MELLPLWPPMAASQEAATRTLAWHDDAAFGATVAALLQPAGEEIMERMHGQPEGGCLPSFVRQCQTTWTRHHRKRAELGEGAVEPVSVSNRLDCLQRCVTRR